METNIAKIQKYKSWGMSLTPAIYKPDDKSKDKHPVCLKDEKGKFTWNVIAKKEWTDEDLAAALETKRLAVYHNPGKYGAPGQRFMDAESDDKTFKVNNYFVCFPDSYTIGKKVNGKIITTRKVYKVPEGTKVKNYSYVDKDEGTIVELLTSGYSIIDGLDRLVLDSREPINADPLLIKQHLQLASFFGELECYWSGGRNDNHLMLAGAFATQTNIPLELVKLYVKRFCDLTNDDEVNNRLSRYDYQYKAFKENPTKNIYHIKALADKLKANFPRFDEFKIKDEVDEKEVRKPYPIITSGEFTHLKFPPVEFVMEPLFTNKSTNQIVGPSGVGKTIYGLGLAIHMSSGLDFLGYKVPKKITCAYVEGELPGADILERRDAICNNLYEQNKEVDHNNLFLLTKDNLEMNGFEYGFNMIAVARNMSESDAKDYGRKGREFIDEYLYGIEKITGNKSFLFLDNITALADIDENRSTDWTPIIHWLTKNKTKGFSSCFFHHSNKLGLSSGSSSKERLLDTSILLEKLGEDETFNMPGAKNMECRVTFAKARNFGGSKTAKNYLLTMDQNGVWTKYPDLKQQDFKLIDLWKKGIRTVDELNKDSEISLAKKTIYSHLKVLKDMKLISDKDLNPLDTEAF